MLKYAKIEGMVGDENLPGLNLSEMDLKIGNVPNWKILLDPDYTKEASYLNRCTGIDCFDIDGSPMTPNIVNESGNSFARYGDGDNPRIQCDVALPSDKISIFGVLRPALKSSNNRFTLITSNSAIEPIPQLNFGFSGDLKTLGVSTRGNTNGGNENYMRISYSPEVSFENRLVYIMMTFSTENGLVLYENGEKVAENKDDTRPFVLSDTSDLYTMLRGICGDVGICGVVGDDLSLKKNMQYKESIDAFLKGKYNM